MMADESDSTDEELTELPSFVHDHYNYMEARENLQEFPGRVPQRKKKSESMNPQQHNKPKVGQKNTKPYTFLHLLFVYNDC